jgi:hypothetical protein
VSHQGGISYEEMWVHDRIPIEMEGNSPTNENMKYETMNIWNIECFAEYFFFLVSMSKNLIVTMYGSIIGSFMCLLFC